MEKEKTLERTLVHVVAGTLAAGAYVFRIVPSLEYLTIPSTMAAGLAGAGLTTAVYDLIDNYKAYRKQPETKRKI